MDILTGDRLLDCTELLTELWDATKVKHFMQLWDWMKKNRCTRTNGHKLQQGKFLLNHEKEFFTVRKNTGTYWKWGCAISSLEDTQNSTEQSLEQSALMLKHALLSEVSWTRDLLSYLTAWMIATVCLLLSEGTTPSVWFMILFYIL